MRQNLQYDVISTSAYLTFFDLFVYKVAGRSNFNVVKCVRTHINRELLYN